MLSQRTTVTLVNDVSGFRFALTVQGVFTGKSAKKINSTKVSSAEEFTLRIPVSSVTDAVFITAKNWGAISSPDMSPLFCCESGEPLTTESGEPFEFETDYWTLAPQQTWVIPGTVSSSELLNFQALLSSHDAYRVVSVSDNRRDVMRLQHWRCVCDG